MGLFKNTNKGLFGGALKRGLNNLVGSGVVSSAASFIPGVGGIVSNVLNNINDKIDANSNTEMPIDKPISQPSPTGTQQKSAKVKIDNKAILILGALILGYFFIKK